LKGLNCVEDNLPKREEEIEYGLDRQSSEEDNYEMPSQESFELKTEEYVTEEEDEESFGTDSSGMIEEGLGEGDRDLPEDGEGGFIIKLR